MLAPLRGPSRPGEWQRTRNNATAVRTGHADTGKVIVAAVSIMVFVFGAFVTGDSRTIKLVGLGMAAARPSVVDAEPAGRIQDVLDLFDELARIARMSAGLFAGIEQVTGLRVGEVQLLRSVAGDTVEVRELARRVGQTDEATAATIDGLVRRGLLHREHRPAKPERLHLTGNGTALLEQTEGVQVRLLDTLISRTGTHGVKGFRTTLRGIADVLRTIADRTGTTGFR